MCFSNENWSLQDQQCRDTKDQERIAPVEEAFHRSGAQSIEIQFHMFQNYNPNMKTRKLSINGSPGNFRSVECRVLHVQFAKLKLTKNIPGACSRQRRGMIQSLPPSGGSSCGFECNMMVILTVHVRSMCYYEIITKRYIIAASSSSRDSSTVLYAIEGTHFRYLITTAISTPYF